MYLIQMGQIQQVNLAPLTINNTEVSAQNLAIHAPAMNHLKLINDTITKSNTGDIWQTIKTELKMCFQTIKHYKL